MLSIANPKEIPMMFIPMLAGAIWNGKKTMTRRPVPEWQLASLHPETGCFAALAKRDAKGGGRHGFTVSGQTEEECMLKLAEHKVCPFGNAGDVIWGKETWGVISQPIDTDNQPLSRHFKVIEDVRFGKKRYSGCAIYRADGEHEWKGKALDGEVWHSSMLMPRSVSRLTLAVIATKVERLHSINHEDALAEGKNSVEEFHDLWRGLYGADEWDKNPWVWAISFRKN